MVRMSDIFKRENEEGERKRKEGVSQPAGTEEKKEQKEERPKTSERRISPLVMKDAKTVTGEDAEKLYEETENLLREIYKENKIDYKAIDINRISGYAERIIMQLKSGKKEEMLKLALVKNSPDLTKCYLTCHLLNVCIFSIEIGLVLGYKGNELAELGISALFHDIGMAGYCDLASKQKKFAPDEYAQIKHHPSEGVKILENIKDINKEIIYVAEQHHERGDGSGYPKNLKLGSIEKYARIISLVDIYEAMTHPRAYRDAYSSTETMREILDNKNAFDTKIIKILIKNLGIFPIGSIVELSTKEKAMVVRLNPNVPLRPVVDIVADGDDEPVTETKRLDLMTEPNIHIARALKQNELHVK